MLEAELAQGDYQMTFVHYDKMDGIGHSKGYASKEYLDEVPDVDEYVGRIVNAIASRPFRDDEEWMIVITTDHGGIGKSHGNMREECRRIPLILSGDKIKKGTLARDCESPVSHMDVYPSVMEYLRLPISEDWKLDG